MRPIVIDGVAWSVCLSVTIVSPARMAEPIEMPFGLWVRVGPCVMYWMGSRPYPAMQRRNFEGSCPLWSLVTVYRDLCKNGWTNRDTVWDVDSGGSKEARVTWGCTSANTTEPSTCGCDGTFCQITLTAIVIFRCRHMTVIGGLSLWWRQKTWKLPWLFGLLRFYRGVSDCVVRTFSDAHSAGFLFMFLMWVGLRIKRRRCTDLCTVFIDQTNICLEPSYRWIVMSAVSDQRLRPECYLSADSIVEWMIVILVSSCTVPLWWLYRNQKP